MATIATVAPSELIRTTWGNSVADELNNNTVKHTGNHTMSGSLVAPLFIGTAQASDANAATRKDYVDGRDTNVYDAAVAFYNTLNSVKVDKSGDTMTGALVVGELPYSEQPGTYVGPVGSCASLVAAADTANIYLFKKSPNFAAGSTYIGFYAQNGATALGSINMTSISSVAYNTSSDYRLKDDLGPIVDPVGKLMALQPKHLRWKSDSTEFDGFIAHELADVVPYAVTGTKDAVDGDGNILPQQMDQKAVVPLLAAALQEAHTLIADLTARITALEAAP